MTSRKHFTPVTGYPSTNNINTSPYHVYLDIILVFPQVLLVTIQPFVDDLGEVGRHLRSWHKVPRSISLGMFPERRWCLSNDKDLVDCAVVDFITTVIRPERKEKQCFKLGWTDGWMDEWYFRPPFCTIKAELGWGQLGLMR